MDSQAPWQGGSRGYVGMHLQDGRHVGIPSGRGSRIILLGCSASGLDISCTACLHSLEVPNTRTRLAEVYDHEGRNGLCSDAINVASKASLRSRLSSLIRYRAFRDVDFSFRLCARHLAAGGSSAEEESVLKPQVDDAPWQSIDHKSIYKLGKQ